MGRRFAVPAIDSIHARIKTKGDDQDAPYIDQGYRSYELLDQLKSMIETANAVGGGISDLSENQYLIDNLRLLAEMATVGADQIQAWQDLWIEDAC